MLIFLSVILLILLLSSDAPAQAPYYQGKTMTFIVGSGAGTAYDMYARLLGQSHRQVHSRQSERDRAEYAGGGRHRRGELRLRRGQARRLDRCLDQSGALFQSAPRQQGNKVRLDEIYLARQFRQIRAYALHAHRRAVQIDAGYPQGHRGAQVRRHRHGHQRPLHPAHAGRSARHQVYDRHRLRRRQ